METGGGDSSETGSVTAGKKSRRPVLIASSQTSGGNAQRQQLLSKTHDKILYVVYAVRGIHLKRMYSCLAQW